MERKLKYIIESLLFASDTPLNIHKIKTIIESTTAREIQNCISELNKEYDKTNRSIIIVEVAEGYQIVTREEYASYIKKLYKGRAQSRLTQRALETLSIIAYKQPVTKQEIENIRGVNVDGVVKTLLERNLITITGREKAPGSPLLYGTTKHFLEYFGLKSLDALPKLKEIDELLKADEKFLENLDQVKLEQLKPEALGIKNVNKNDQNQVEIDMTDKDVDKTE
jgi:segregation and condensation protein B